MNAEIVKQGRDNWQMLQDFVASEERNDASLARRGEHFRRNLAERQARNTAKILAHPESKAYRDYIETPAHFEVPPPRTARRKTKVRA